MLLIDALHQMLRRQVPGPYLFVPTNLNVILPKQNRLMPLQFDWRCQIISIIDVNTVEHRATFGSSQPI